MENDSDSTSLAGIDDLVQDRMDGVPSATSDTGGEAAPTQAAETQAAEPVNVNEAEPVAQAAAAETPSTQPEATQPTPPTYKIGDREYTAQEILAWQTSAQQLPHLQKKYMEALEQRASQPSQAQPSTAQTQPQVQPQQVLAQLKAKYEPEMQDLVKKGLMSQDFVTLFPAEAAQMLAYRDSFGQVAQAVQAIGSQIMQQNQQSQATGLINEVGRNISNLAQSGEAFAPLKDPQQVQGFMNYLWNLNPQVMHLKNPEFLAGQWVAYNRNQYLQMAQQQAQNQQRQQQLRLATADASTGSRPMGSTPVEKSPLDQMVEDFMQRSL